MGVDDESMKGDPTGRQRSAVIGRLVYGPLRRLQRLYWRAAKPQTLGVRALVVSEDDAVLLVRHSYDMDFSGHSWYLPGGRVGRGESLVEAVRRELAEEVGVRVLAKEELLGVYTNTVEGKRDHVVAFVVRMWDRWPTASAEIVEARFFPSRDLPEGTSPATQRRIAELLGDERGTFEW